MTANHRLYYQAVSRFEKIGPVRLRRLLGSLGNIQNVWQADAISLMRAGLEESVAAEFSSWRKDRDPETELRNLEREEIAVLTWEDDEYPALLKEIHDPPHTLFVRGRLNHRDFFLAVVGTRKLSSYGRQAAEAIVAPLARSGMTIISGLALGIDALVHEITLREHGKTIAVLGGGCDRETVYPVINRNLGERIVAEGGALISEYPPGTLSMPYHFPSRNRIISGLSRGTLVIEAAEDSGSLITARCALDQNREVFAVPGDITRDTSIGPNNLLKMGAHVAITPEDILEVLNLQDLKATAEAQEIIPDDPTEAKILAHLKKQPIHIDELIKMSGLDSSQVGSSLTLMEMKGKVRHLGGMHYVLAR
ncbi:MAG: DNA-processing protein DprA [Patescibacteria group bacterium]